MAPKTVVALIQLQPSWRKQNSEYFCNITALCTVSINDRVIAPHTEIITNKKNWGCKN